MRLKILTPVLCLIGMSLVATTTQARTAQINDAQGTVLGRAVLTQGSHGLNLRVRVKGLTPGGHGIHLHAVGKCEGPAFTSAGPHLNPAGKQHGLENPMGSHMGDLPNLIVKANGKADFKATIHAGDMASVFDSDGSALIIHAQSDDLKSDPTGNSGPRQACAAFSSSGL